MQYVDLLWPGRWAQYRASQGNHYIEQSQVLLQQGEYALALLKLRVGLVKAPANAPGRRLLARLYLAYRRPDLAREVLLEGLSYLADDPAYLQTTLAFLLESQEDAKLLEITSRLLADAANHSTRPLIATFAATAEFDTGAVGRLPDHLGQFLRSRQPSREILSRARAALGSDRHLLLLGQADLLASLQTALARHPP